MMEMSNQITSQEGDGICKWDGVIIYNETCLVPTWAARSLSEDEAITPKETLRVWLLFTNADKDLYFLWHVLRSYETKVELTGHNDYRFGGKKGDAQLWSMGVVVSWCWAILLLKDLVHFKKSMASWRKNIIWKYWRKNVDTPVWPMSRDTWQLKLEHKWVFQMDTDLRIQPKWLQGGFNTTKSMFLCPKVLISVL